MLRNSQYFKPVPIANGDSTIILGYAGYAAEFKLGSEVLAKLDRNGYLDFVVTCPQSSNKTIVEKHELSYVFLKDWTYGNTMMGKWAYLKEPKIKTSILKNHFRQVNKGELLKIKCYNNNKYSSKYSNTYVSYPNEFLFKKFEEETMMFLGSEMKPLSTEEYHTNIHLRAAKNQNEIKNTQSFLHMNFLVGQRKISYSELDFLHGDLFVDSFCYNKGSLYTNKNKKDKGKTHG